LKQNKTTLIFLTLILIFSGILLIYRAHQKTKDFQKFDGTVTNLKIQGFKSGKSGLKYSLEFGISETDKIYGIYIGTKDQAYNNKLKSNIKIGKTYSFFIDQTVLPQFNGHILAIKEIRNNEHIIYKENKKFNYVGGSIFLIMGIGILLLLVFADKLKKNAL
jgi:hypothetical protein